MLTERLNQDNMDSMKKEKENISLEKGSLSSYFFLCDIPHLIKTKPLDEHLTFQLKPYFYLLENLKQFGRKG
jgi:hypothetical protein